MCHPYSNSLSPSKSMLIIIISNLEMAEIGGNIKNQFIPYEIKNIVFSYSFVLSDLMLVLNKLIINLRTHLQYQYVFSKI